MVIIFLQHRICFGHHIVKQIRHVGLQEKTTVRKGHANSAAPLEMSGCTLAVVG